MVESVSAGLGTIPPPSLAVDNILLEAEDLKDLWLFMMIPDICEYSGNLDADCKLRILDFLSRLRVRCNIDKRQSRSPCSSTSTRFRRMRNARLKFPLDVRPRKLTLVLYVGRGEISHLHTHSRNSSYTIPAYRTPHASVRCATE